MADTAVALLQNFVSALQRNSRRDSNQAAFALLALNAPLADKWRLIAKVMQTNGELTAANRAMELFVAQTAQAPAACFEQAAVAAQSGRLESAWEIMATVPAHVPDPASHDYLLGMMSLNMGEVDRAERHLVAALDSNPRLGQALLALAAARRRAGDDPIGERIIEAAPQMAGAPMLEQAQYHLAAGQVHFDRGEVDRAFASMATGAALASRERPYDAKADRGNAALSRSGFDRPLIERVASRVCTDTSEAILVTGLPRSGTTLVEQILASHSAVAGGEELGRMSVVRRDLPENSAAGLDAYLQTGEADELARLYLHLCRERFGEGMRYVDKSIGSTRHIGLTAALLPQSPIVWLRRDPLDCALSAYRTWFAQGLDWSWRLEDIAAHFRIEDELYAFWTEMLPDRILVVDYPELVREPREQIERILAHCGLPVEPRVFEPHKTRRIVTTASVVQVREPINPKGVGSAEPYREHMRPFLDAYAR